MNKGETITEALTALLIAAIAGILMAGAMVFAGESGKAADRIRQSSNEELQELTDFLAEDDISGEGSRIKIKGEEEPEDETYIRIYSGESTGLFAFRLE